MTAAAENKRRLRLEAAARRDALGEEVRTRKSRQITSRLVQLRPVRAAQVIMAYAPVRSEVDTRDLLQWAWREGKTVGLPVVNREAGELLVVPTGSWSELKPGAFGVMEPDPLVGQLDPRDIDVVIVPGVAFDVRGYRLGYGTGYYDRFLPKTAAEKIGICFQEQLYPHIPAEPHDAVLDLVVTDKQVIRCRKQSEFA